MSKNKKPNNCLFVGMEEKEEELFGMNSWKAMASLPQNNYDSFDSEAENSSFSKNSEKEKGPKYKSLFANKD